jgi:hypothetical protein
MLNFTLKGVSLFLLDGTFEKLLTWSIVSFTGFSASYNTWKDNRSLHQNFELLYY